MTDNNRTSLALQYLRQQQEFGINEIILEPKTTDIEKNKIDARPALVELYNQVKDCQNCVLGSTRTNFVFGAGNPNAELMFIGEAPGRDEDLQGIPFVGAAGKLLTKMIEAMGLKREDVFIANILKCRPPNNRDPMPKEMTACNSILMQQISIIKPTYICALGRIAAQSLLDTKTPLGKLRGSFHEWNGIRLLVTYHPSALLRNPNWKKPAWEDLQILMKELGLKG